MTSKTLPLALAATFLLAACDEHGHGEDPDAEACEHLAEGPATAVTAVTPSGDSAPAVAADHRRYDVTLVDVAGGKGGAVKLASGAAGELLVFLDADVPLRVADGGDNDVTPSEKLTGSDTCAAIAARYSLPLGVGTYYLEFGPTSATEVSLVVEEALVHAE